MVHGIEKFLEYFSEHSQKYVLIGGSACDILLTDLGVPFRATKDLDMVLIIEELDHSFGHDFWEFIRDGGYENRLKSSGKPEFYRFSNPSDSSFPKMLEIFSRNPGYLQLQSNAYLGPIHIDETILSLSAILLDNCYYQLLVSNRRVVSGLSVLDLEIIILFKVRAWLDLKKRKDSQEHVNSGDIKKHKNDVFRLLTTVLPSTKINLSDEIKEDVNQFILEVEQDPPNLKDLGIGETLVDMLNLMKRIYLT